MREELAKLNVSKSKFDDAIFYYHKNNNLEGIVSTHVDDVFWGGTQAFQENVIGFLKNIFRISKENQHTFVYLGLTMKQNECDIELNQDNYISEMSLVEIQNEQSRSPDDALLCIEDKRLRVDVATLRERLHIGELSAVKWVDTSKQIANCFTKSGTSSTLLFDVLRSSKVHC